MFLPLFCCPYVSRVICLTHNNALFFFKCKFHACLGFGLLWICLTLVLGSGSFCSNWSQSVSMASLTSGEWFSKAAITRSVKVKRCSCRLLDLLHSFHWKVSETIQLDCACTCNVLFRHLIGHPGRSNSLLIPRIFCLFSYSSVH